MATTMRRYGFTTIGMVFVIVAGFFINWNDVWSFLLWVVCMLFTCANLMNIIRYVDQRKTADTWYNKMVEVRQEFAMYRVRYTRPELFPGFKKIQDTTPAVEED